ncbi:MAG: signal peptidase I [Chitinivibrionales bacterium]|nr:signal peptidase I [Chitinivibrionales bacterium]MBD3396396.1 signal peptidase I [Chitinivibrionales bacterium]
MNGTHTQQRAPLDFRLMAYRVVKLLLIAVLAGVAVKWALFDTVLITTDQMMPALLPGDRVLLSRAACAPPLQWFVRLSRRTPVVFRHPRNDTDLGCLRIAGIPGDIVSISNGIVSILNEPTEKLVGKEDSADVLPPGYSPRDWIDPFRLPVPGDTYALDTLTLRDFIFLWAVIQQENSPRKYILQPWIQVDDSIVADYFISDFSLYKGPLGEVPAHLANQWFFWDRLEEYLAAVLTGNSVSLGFSLTRDGSAVDTYRVKESYYFLVADNWRDGFDSRYTGPVGGHLFKGAVVCVAWSFTPGRRFLSGLRAGRLCRIVN